MNKIEELKQLNENLELSEKELKSITDEEQKQKLFVQITYMERYRSVLEERIAYDKNQEKIEVLKSVNTNMLINELSTRINVFVQELEPDKVTTIDLEGYNKIIKIGRII